MSKIFSKQKLLLCVRCCCPKKYATINKTNFQDIDECFLKKKKKLFLKVWLICLKKPMDFVLIIWPNLEESFWVRITNYKATF